MIAYMLKWKGKQVQDWEIGHDDFHECMSDDCCHSGSGTMEAGLPIYATKQELISMLIFNDWSFNIGEGKKTEYVSNTFRGEMKDKLMKVMGLRSFDDQVEALKKIGLQIVPIRIQFRW